MAIVFDCETGEASVVADETLSLDELKAAALAAAADQFNTRRQSPMAWDFGSIGSKDDLGTDMGAAGAQTLQMRDDTEQDDWKNWLAVAQGAAVAVMGGAGTTVQPIKVTANVWVQTTAAELMQVLVTGDGTQTSALQRGVQMLAAYGALKKQINAATDAAGVAAIDVTAGWPA